MAAISVHGDVDFSDADDSSTQATSPDLAI
jgi:hypothetical protein